MQIFNTQETWLVALTDKEVISVTAMLLHCQNNGITATKEEKLKALDYFKDKIIKDKILDKEIKKVKGYESTYKKGTGKETRTKAKCNRDS